MLAQDGFTGPTAVFEGEGGLWEVIGRHEWPLPEGMHMITQTHIKGLPVCYHGQSTVYAALELRERVALDAIESIQVDTYRTAVSMMGADPTRWAPATRETADHSMPYVVAAALLDGKVVDESFAEDRLRDPAIARLMSKVKVAEDARLSGLYPEGSPGRVSVCTANGKSHTVEVIYPKGHAKNPMSDTEVIAKFHDMTGARLTQPQRERVLEALWTIEHCNDVAGIVRLLFI